MDPVVFSLLQALGTVGGFALLVYLCHRFVFAAKKAGGTGSAELLATLLLALGIGIAPAPPREVKIEVKRDEDESGDPLSSRTPTQPTEPTGRKAE